LNFLLDTRLLLWAAGQTDRLPSVVRDLFLDSANQPVFSAASIWEITIKRGLGRPDFDVDPRRLWRMLLANGYRELAVTSEHAIAAHDFSLRHKDPFDSILIAQARTEAMLLITTDAIVAAYGAGVLQV
jgi:PIN domain nuclease of toxin-antitoxin system